MATLFYCAFFLVIVSGRQVFYRILSQCFSFACCASFRDHKMVVQDIKKKKKSFLLYGKIGKNVNSHSLYVVHFLWIFLFFGYKDAACMLPLALYWFQYFVASIRNLKTHLMLLWNICDFSSAYVLLWYVAQWLRTKIKEKLHVQNSGEKKITLNFVVVAFSLRVIFRIWAFSHNIFPVVHIFVSVFHFLCVRIFFFCAMFLKTQYSTENVYFFVLWLSTHILFLHSH